MTEPLEGDARRQATAALRGYRYQILRTLYEWLHLDEGERLYLEAAEDFDRVSGVNAQATQVKHSDTDVTVTLRSSAVVAAINNYWILRRRNPQRHVRLNFLTTAGVGVETGALLGTDRAGLDLWSEAAQASAAMSEESTVVLTRFLLNEGTVSGELAEFLKTAAPAEVHSELLRPVTWRTREPGIGDVESALLSGLGTLCTQRGIPSSWAGKVLDRLVSAAWAAITQLSPEARVLTREDFKRELLEVQTIALPVAALPEFLTGAIAQSLASFGINAGGVSVALAASGSRLTLAPPLLGNRITRDALQATVIGLLRRFSLVELQGSTGLGKTTQAISIATALESPYQWVNCRGIDETQLRLLLNELARRVESLSPLRYLVFDDLDVLEHVRTLEESLPGMLYVLRQRDGGMILTGDRPLPQRLLARLGLTTKCIVSIPRFDETEVRELLKNAGLSDGALLGVWAQLILAKTRGHPQLVTAHIATLSREGFPQPAYEDLANVPEELKDVREAARLMLGRELSQGEKELLYRLSVVTGTFERERALALAQWEPPIGQPGDVFDSLVGPWIERISNTHYRLSPLLDQVGQDANGAVWGKGMRKAIAWTWLEFGQQTPWDVATILMSATVAEDYDAIVRLGLGMFNVNAAAWAAVAEASLLFVYFYASSGARFPGDLVQGFYFRWIQMQLATHGAPKALEDVIARVEEEFPPRAAEQQVVVYGYLLRLQALANSNDLLDVRTLVRLIRGIEGLTSTVIDRVRAISDPGDKETELAIGDSQPPRMLGVFLVRKVSTATALEEALAAVGELEPGLRSRCLVLFRESPDIGRQWADSLWLTEQSKSEPQWRPLVQTLCNLYAHALSWQELTLAQSVASVLARVLQENLSDTAAALAVLSEAPTSGDALYLLRDAHAKILFQTRKPAQALALWTQVLAGWPQDITGNLVGFAIAARNAAMAAANLGEWTQATDLFARAAAPGLELLDPRFACGLVADAAHAAWHAGDLPRAVTLAGQAIETLTTIPNTSEDLRSFYLHKSIGHLMTWMTDSRRRDDSPWREPAPGTSSSLDPPEKVSEYNPTPVAMTQFQLVTAAQMAGLPLQPLQNLIESLRSSPYPVVRANLTHLLLDDAIEQGAVDHMVPDLVLFSRAQSASEQQKSAGVPLWLPYEPAPGQGEGAPLSAVHAEFWQLEFVLALLSMAARRLAMGSTLRSWHAEAVEAGAPEAVIEWLAHVCSLENSAARAVWRGLRDPNAQWSTRVAAMAILLGRPVIDPIFIVHAHVDALVLAESSAGKLLETSTCRAVTQAWKGACERPVTLRRPTEGIPALLSACAEPGDSWGKVGRMFLAAVALVEEAIPSEIIARAQRLAQP